MLFSLKIQRCLLLLLAVIVLLCNNGNADLKSGKGTRTDTGSADQFITWTYKEAPMGLYIPEKKTDKPLPIVMFLHACHNDPVSRYLWIISALNDIEPCAVFLPTAPEAQNTQYACADWGGTYDSQLRPQMINALTELDSLIVAHDFDTKRQYLYGESMGGEGVYRLLMDFPARFAGAVSAAGYSVNKGANKMAKTPLWILIGSDDEMSPVDSARTIYNSIVNAGGTMVKYTEYPDLSHVAAIEQAREEPEIVKWLLVQNRSTGVINKIKFGRMTKGTIPELSFIDGTPHVSSPFADGTTFKLFDLNGSLLFRTETPLSNVSISVGGTCRTLIWNASNSHSNFSGKVLYNPK
jgi:poly(3-hydroxybutyrate) depolymerase